MAKITLREILGHENPSISRFSINQNFKTLEESWNVLQDHINTSVPGGAGKLSELLLTSNSTNNLNFKSEGSGQFDGNLRIGENNEIEFITVTDSFNPEPIVIITANVLFSGNFEVNGDGGNGVFNLGSALPVDFVHDGALIEKQFIPNDAIVLNTAAPAAIELDNKRVVWLENASDENKILTLDITTVEEGQRIVFMMSDNQFTANTITLNLQDPNPNVPSPMFGNVADDWVNQWVEVVFLGGASWRILGSNLV